MRCPDGSRHSRNRHPRRWHSSTSLWLRTLPPVETSLEKSSLAPDKPQLLTSSSATRLSPTAQQSGAAFHPSVDPGSRLKSAVDPREKEKKRCSIHRNRLFVLLCVFAVASLSHAQSIMLDLHRQIQHAVVS